MKFKNANKFEYLPAFDILRAFSVAVVLFVHGLHDLIPGGWVAVDLFFVISGYLITCLLLKEYEASGKILIGKFYLRRALRLLPALTVTIIFANILWPYTADLYDGKQLLATLAAAFYFTNAIKGNVAGNLFHLWSLSVEEHFYLIWPFVVTMLVKRTRKFAIRFVIALLVLIAILKIVYVNIGIIITWKDLFLEGHLFTPFKIDAIVCGCLLALLCFKRPLVKTAWEKSIWVLIALLYAWIILSLDKRAYWLQSGGFVLVNALCSFTVLLAANTGLQLSPKCKFIEWIGKRSYGIYLYHIPVFMFIDNANIPHNRPHFAMLFGIKILITLLLAALSYRYAELPFLRLKKRFKQMPGAV